MNSILLAIAIIGGTGLIGGVLLAVISHFCDTGETNERLAEIRLERGISHLLKLLGKHDLPEIIIQQEGPAPDPLH